MVFATGLPIKPGEFGPYRPETIKKKEPFVQRPKQARTFRDHCHENGSADQAHESSRLAAIRQGEKPEDA